MTTHISEMTTEEYAEAYKPSLADKIARMAQGERVIVNDRELDAMLLIDDRAYTIRTIPNPKRLGLLDQYIGWMDK